MHQGLAIENVSQVAVPMVAMYYGKIKNDDEYNLVRAKYGDSTDAAAQVQAFA